MIESPLKQNKIVSINDLNPHPRNYRSHPEAQINKLVASLTRFGQGRSIVIQDGPEGYLIVAGHGIVEAATRLHYKELRADILPANWTSEQVDGYLVADNLHSQDAEDDERMLAILLEEQRDAGFDLASLGTDENALEDLLAKLTPPTLDELEEKYGDAPEDDAFWPVIRIKVSPETKELYESLMEEAVGTDESAKFAWLMERVDVAMEDEDE